jgi:hypothetical protein
MKYCVYVLYRGTSNYIVEAATPEEAEEKAREEYANGAMPPLLGNEWEEIENISCIEEVPPCKAD